MKENVNKLTINKITEYPQNYSIMSVEEQMMAKGGTPEWIRNAWNSFLDSLSVEFTVFRLTVTITRGNISITRNFEASPDNPDAFEEELEKMGNELGGGTFTAKLCFLSDDYGYPDDGGYGCCYGYG